MSGECDKFIQALDASGPADIESTGKSLLAILSSELPRYALEESENNLNIPDYRSEHGPLLVPRLVNFFKKHDLLNDQSTLSCIKILSTLFVGVKTNQDVARFVSIV